jgi:hypothetical protein
VSGDVPDNLDQLLVAIVGQLTASLRDHPHHDQEYVEALSDALLSGEEDLASKLEELVVIAARRGIAASTT